MLTIFMFYLRKFIKDIKKLQIQFKVRLFILLDDLNPMFIDIETDFHNFKKQFIYPTLKNF